MAELGEPFGRLWTMLSSRHGAHEGARLLAKILGAIDEHGAEPVVDAVAAALDAGRCDLLALGRLAASPAQTVQVPETLRGIEVERRSVHQYDALLCGGKP